MFRMNVLEEVEHAFVWKRETRVIYLDYVLKRILYYTQLSQSQVHVYSKELVTVMRLARTIFPSTAAARQL